MKMNLTFQWVVAYFIFIVTHYSTKKFFPYHGLNGSDLSTSPFYITVLETKENIKSGHRSFEKKMKENRECTSGDY